MIASDTYHFELAGYCRWCGGRIYFDPQEEKMVYYGGSDCYCEMDEELEKEMAV